MVSALYGNREDDGKLEAAVERHGQAREPRIRLPRAAVGRERLGVREDVVGHHDAAGPDAGPHELEEPLVVVLLGVEEDDVERLLEVAQRREGVARDELGAVGEARFGDVRPPRLDLAWVALERDSAKAAAWRENVDEAGLAEWVELVEADAFAYLGELEDIFDVVFLDAEKDDYAPLFALARERVEPGALIVADNVLSHVETLGAYSAARQADDALESVTVPLDRGLELSVVLTARRNRV